MPTPTELQIASVPIFERLAPADRGLLADISEVRSYAPGATVFVEGEPADVMLTILSGRVRVTAPAASTELPDVLEAGDPLGDVAALEGGPYPATGTAIEPTDCLVIRRADLFGLIDRHPTLVRGLIHGLTRRIVQLTRELRRRG
jgi:CRP/FNR family transcriptional regulator